MKKTSYTLADIINQFLEPIHNRLTAHQLSTLKQLAVCRTSILGGHWESCNACGFMRKHYNSCGNRSCPNCQGVAKEKWLLNRTYDLLPVKYFHCVFTVPFELRTVFYLNQKILYSLLHQSVKETLLEFGQDKRQKLMAKVGGISILHTWTQQMEYHPHIHCIVPGGGLTKKGEWKTSKGKDNFLFHVKAMSTLFKKKLMYYLHELVKNGKITLPYNWLNKSNDLNPYYLLKDKLYKKKWVVYAKQAFAGPKQVFEYLARYTHKVCISNYRIIKVTNTQVTFRYLDRKNNLVKFKTLPGYEFLKLFSKHILPKGFIKIRHFGFLSTRSKNKDIQLIRKSLGVQFKQHKKKLSTREVIIATTGKDPYLCPCCKKGEMVVVELIPCTRGSPSRISLNQLQKLKYRKLKFIPCQL